MDVAKSQQAESDIARGAYLDLISKVILNETNPENGARMKFLVDHIVTNKASMDRVSLIAKLVQLCDEPEIQEALEDRYRPRHWWTKTLSFPFSMVGQKRLANVRMACETVIADRIEGDFVETGVWRGGCCIMMKAVSKILNDPRDVYVCDSFEGLPDLSKGPDAVLTLNENPILTAPLTQVRSHFERLDMLDDKVHFIKGWFEDTMPVLAKTGPEKIAVLRLDGDYYKSTMDVLTTLYDKVPAGGFCIIDDYHAYEQCEQAVTEFRQSRNITAKIHEIDGVGTYWRVE